MPVSEPSYFPPQRANDVIIGLNAGQGYVGARAFLAGLDAGFQSTVTDLIVIGDSAFANGSIDASLDGSIIIGSGTANLALLGGTGTGPAANPGPATIIGFNSFSTPNTGIGGNCIVGANFLDFMPQYNAQDYSGNSVLGTGIAQGTGLIGFGNAPFTGNVLIGYEVLATPGTGSGASIIDCVMLGRAACPTLSIGTGHVVVGATAAVSNDNHVNSVVIGFGAKAAGSRCIVIGESANFTIATDDGLVIGNSLGTLIFGDIDAGNIAFGSQPALNGTNTLFLTNGTKGVAPIGGGYFYVALGALHWVDTAGNDSTLDAGTAGQLAQTLAAVYSNNAAAAVATLTNAPVAGNPTKWIPINDNGTIRNIPAW